MSLKSSGRSDFAQVSINQYFDRNPSQKSSTYNAIVAPHGSTNRWSYTVPANRKAFVKALQSSIVRVTAAAPAGQPVCQVVLNGSVAIAFSTLFTNNIGDKDESNTSGLDLLAGDTILGNTSDGSTGGTCMFFVSAAIMEFDA